METHGEALAISGALKFTVEVPELREQRDRLPRQLRSKGLGEPSQGPGSHRIHGAGIYANIKGV